MIVVNDSLLRRFHRSYDIMPDGKRCWEWNRASTRGGYGHISCPVKNSDGSIRNKMVRSHRVSMAIHGKTPERKWVLHKCDNRKCVNPSHLYLGDSKDNTLDKVNRNRQSKGEQVHSKGRRNLNPEAVKYLREMYQYLTQTELSLLMDISKSQVERIVNRKTWRWV